MFTQIKTFKEILDIVIERIWIKTVVKEVFII